MTDLELKDGYKDAIEDKFGTDKNWAYVAIAADVSTLGIAVQGEAGYTPIPDWMCHFADYGVADDYATKLNSARGISPKDSLTIVGSTMGGLNKSMSVG